MNRVTRFEKREDLPALVGRALAWLSSVEGRRWLLRALLAYAVIGVIVWIRRPGDFAGYLVVGNLVLSGGHIYHDAPAGLNTWPPFFSLGCVPLALLAMPTPYLARGVWLLLNVGLVLLALHLIARLVYGRRLSLRAESTGLSLAAPEMVLPLLLTDRYVSGNFDHLQVNIAIFVLALAGLYLQRQAREVAGSLALGVAAALKVMPVIFIPYLAYRGRWRAALSTTLFAAGCSLSPILVFGWSRFWDYVLAWRGAVAVGWGVGKMNQSVFAMWDRFLGHGMLPFTVAGTNDVPASGGAWISAAVIGSLAAVTMLALVLFRGRPKRENWATLAEWSVVFIVSAIFAPVTWKAFLVVLLLPNALLFAVWRRSDLDPGTRRAAGWLLASAFVIGTLPSPGLVGKWLAGALEMASAVTVSALLLLGASLWLRARLA